MGMTFTVTCQDPPPEEDYTDDREISLQRVRWLDHHVGAWNWKQDLEWSDAHCSWTHHYELDCPASIAMLFKLTWG